MKTNFLKRAPLILTLAGGTIFLMSMSSTSIKLQAMGPWVAPAKADTIKNPLKGKPDAIAAGKKLYATYCTVCHGDKGKGDGIAAAGLNPRPANHTTEKFQSQSDGAIYWKITTGRAPMASYEKTLTVAQRWQVIDYIRTLKAK
jgi:mono/diheme cytochrome c family protein